MQQQPTRFVLITALTAIATAITACEPEGGGDPDAATLTATLFTPTGQVDCSKGCAFDLGDVTVSTTRETPLVFATDKAVVISDVTRDGCELFSIRIPGPFTSRSTTSIRLVAETATRCDSTFTFVSDAKNAADIVVDVSANITATEAAADPR